MTKIQNSKQYNREGRAIQFDRFSLENVFMDRLEHPLQLPPGADAPGYPSGKTPPAGRSEMMVVLDFEN